MTRLRSTHRTLRACAWLLVACGAVPLAQAQEPARAPSPEAPAPAAVPVALPRTTGDPSLDLRLLDIDRYGARYRAAFVDELVRYHAAPRDLVRALLDRGWSPGDVYYACALAYSTGRACRLVTDTIPDGAGPDWAAIAQRLGVEPDSPRLARLHERIEATYRRWGRPLPPDVAVADTPVAARSPAASPRTTAADANVPRRKRAGED